MEPTMQAQFDRTNILMKEFVDTVFSFYNHIKDQDVCQMADEQTLEKIRKQSIPQQGRPVEEVYREMLSDIYPNMSRVQHPRCFACIPSPVSLQPLDESRGEFCVSNLFGATALYSLQSGLVELQQTSVLPRFPF